MKLDITISNKNLPSKFLTTLAFNKGKESI